jgi:alkanesulfonate monooxygenase SsuD/methylene tetrahydromethanopterin reductase-like flavin-dependent oxidoreductase (luciferase family)
MKKMLGARAGIGMQYQTLEQLMSIGTAVVGTPQTVRERIARMRDKTGIGIFIPMLQFGTLGDALARRNMETFAAEVMPHFRD